MKKCAVNSGRTVILSVTTRGSAAYKNMTSGLRRRKKLKDIEKMFYFACQGEKLYSSQRQVRDEAKTLKHILQIFWKINFPSNLRLILVSESPWPSDWTHFNFSWALLRLEILIYSFFFPPSLSTHSITWARRSPSYWKYIWLINAISCVINAKQNEDKWALGHSPLMVAHLFVMKKPLQFFDSWSSV